MYETYWFLLIVSVLLYREHKVSLSYRVHPQRQVALCGAFIYFNKTKKYINEMKNAQKYLNFNEIC